LGVRSTRSTRIPVAVLGHCGWISLWSLTLLGLLAKQQRPEPLQAEPGLLQGKQQPKIPLEYQVQHAPIGSSQGIPGEPLT
jgi:hypothetical protein